jgi:hypothetical protein
MKTLPRRTARTTATVAAVLFSPFLVANQGCSSASTELSSTNGQAVAGADVMLKAACAELTQPHTRRCRAWVAAEKATGMIRAQAAASGPVAGTYGPPDLRAAYTLPSSGGKGTTIAIVDAQDDANAEADLAVYRSHYGLPPCTTANGCFKKVDQNGGTSYPSEDDGWSEEISLDLDMVSAACPDCKILLVEATSASDTDLNTAIATAASLGAKAISNSWSGPEDSTVTTEEAAYNIPGVTVLAASGDNGFSEGTQFPASSQYVVAVGGTELDKSSSSSRGFSEIVWGTNDPSNDGATGSGCSAYIKKPSWQHDSSCKFKMSNDVSAVGDPVPGLAVYDTENAQGQGATGWVQIGGTSASTPLVAGILGVTGNAGVSPSFFYSASVYDITSGNNGTCSPSYYCDATTGYDGPTGTGTPNASTWSGSPPPPTDAGPPQDSGTPPAGAIVNGGFEDGDLTGWTTSGAGESVVKSGCHSGSYCAMVGKTTATRGSSNVWQTFTAPSGVSQISIWYNESCPGSVSTEWATASIEDNTAGTTHKILVKTCTTAGWKNVTHAITAGHSYTVTLSTYESASDKSPEYALYDDITLE